MYDNSNKYKLTNFFSPELKVFATTTTLLGLIAAAVSTVTFSPIMLGLSVIIPVSATLAGAYFSRYIIDAQYKDSATKCEANHPLYKTVHEVINNTNKDFKNLENIDIFLKHDTSLNAFACGFTQDQAAIYINSGLIARFGNNYSSRELKAIIAHELGHVAGGHIKINSIVHTLTHFIEPVSKYLTKKMGNHDNYKIVTKTQVLNKDEASSEKYLEEESISTDYLSWIRDAAIYVGLKLAQIVTLSSISRQLEYDADNAAVKAGYAKDLAKALKAISHSHSNEANNGLVSYIYESGSTHPSLINRINAINNALKEDKTEYDNIFSYLYNSAQHTKECFVSEHTIHFSGAEIQKSIINALDN